MNADVTTWTEGNKRMLAASGAATWSVSSSVWLLTFRQMDRRQTDEYFAES